MRTITVVVFAGTLVLAPSVKSQADLPAFATLYRFQGGTDGFLPLSGVTIAQNEKLYGTTPAGGSASCPYFPGNKCGTAFELSPPTTRGGAWTLTTIYNFQGGSDAANPTGVLALGKHGDIYGTALGGSGLCTDGCGTVFRLVPPSTPVGTWTEMVLYSFQGGTDGAFPSGGVVIGEGGRLYGTTSGGGDNNQGTVFELTPPEQPAGTWTETVLHRFAGGAEGSNPYASVVVGANSALYGTTYYGGTVNPACPGVSLGCGGVFELTRPSASGGAWGYSALYQFTGGSAGSIPQGGVVIGMHGELYGTTVLGGIISSSCALGCGTVFSLTPPASPGGLWQETVLHAFAGTPDGLGPSAGLVMNATNGMLFGTTYGGGNSACGCGTVFRLSLPPTPGLSWVELGLHSFKGPNSGAAPYVLALGKNGVLYGTTALGGGSTACLPPLSRRVAQTGGSDGANPPPGTWGCGTVYQVIL